jgi:hypothetical protein
MEIKQDFAEGMTYLAHAGINRPKKNYQKSHTKSN